VKIVKLPNGNFKTIRKINRIVQQSIHSNAFIYSIFDNIFAILLNVVEIELTPTPTLWFE
jgi:hypothetical protein